MIKLYIVLDWDEILEKPSATKAFRFHPDHIASYEESDIYPGCTEIVFKNGEVIDALVHPQDLDNMGLIKHSWYVK